MTKSQWTILGIAGFIMLVVWYSKSGKANNALASFFKTALSGPSTEGSSIGSGSNGGGFSPGDKPIYIAPGLGHSCLPGYSYDTSTNLCKLNGS